MIRIEDLSYNFPDGTQGLKKINLEIERGEFLGIVGRNGSGKSTLVRHLNGLLKPMEGKVSINGMDTADPSNLLKIRQTVSMVFQNPYTQFVGITLEEDVAFGPENLALPPKEIQERVDRALEVVGLDNFKNYSPKTLSGGQSQCAAIASALAMKSECIVFDEITSMLDSKSREQIREIIQKLRGEARTIVYVTHRLEEILYADRIIVMDRGEIVREGKPKTVFKDPDTEKFGLETPPVVELLNSLESRGFSFDWARLYSIENLAEEIWESRWKI